MNEDQIKLRHLLDRLTINTITKQEFDELFTLINSGAYESEIKAVLMEGLVNEQLPEIMEKERLDAILRGILPVPAAERYKNETPVRRIFWRRFAAAAAIILLIGAGVWFGLTRTSSSEVAANEQTNKPVNDAAPGGNKAVLTLANGNTIILDNAANGKLASEGSSDIVKSKDGAIAYSLPTGQAGRGETVYNTLSTPRGGQYQLSLPDGSKVWLNSASSITFPTAFTGNERKVAITGEAYFEVAGLVLRTGQKMPFKVEKGNVTIEVLGTHFNVNAYDDEDAFRTTLLEGKVKVIASGGKPVLLAPGQQAQVNQAGAINVLNNADIDEVMAWKNGLFHFENADIKTVMRQLSRWYDIEVEYKGAVTNEPLFIEIPRNTNLADVLKVIESTAKLKLKFEGKKVTVL